MRAALVALLACFGCDADPPSYDVGVSCEAQIGMGESAPAAPYDLVLAISDAPGMGPYFAQLVVNLPIFASVLETVEGGLDSLHVSVVGELGCALVDGPFLIDDGLPWFMCDPPGWCRDRNYEGTLGEALTCLGAVPPSRHGSTAILHDTLRALELELPEFRRPRGYLAILIITATDDTSPGDPTEYAEALRGLVEDPALVLVGVIAPANAPRLDALVAEFPNRSVRISIDADDWTGGLPGLARFNDPRIGGCLRGVVDPLGCVVDDPALPRCVMATPDRPAVDTPLPCWWIRDTDDVSCPQMATVERAAPGFPSVALRCPCP